MQNHERPIPSAEPEAPELVELREAHQRVTERLRAAESSVAELHVVLEQSVARANALVLESQVSSLVLEEIFHASQDAIWVLDRDFRIVRVNERMAKLLGRSRQELLGCVCHEVLRFGLCGTPDCSLERLRGAGGLRSTLTDVEVDFGASGRLGCILSATVCRDPCAEVLGVAEAFTDITARKAAEQALTAANEELARLSRTDALTGLANRRVFDEVIEAEWKRVRRDRQPLSVLLGDVDFFKRYNDTYGHPAGDRCLSSVAQALRSNLKRPADVAARYGGEEFVAVLPYTHAEGARHVAEKIRADVERLAIPHAASDVSACVTLSLGIATVIPGDGDTPADLTRRADEALYRAKDQGRNRVVAHPSRADDEAR